ncbi:hypothetical protein L6452_34896 [Arctium lappa]|uniref:Uncharacterized protein n=1 Tax=Arctium lappa TaxID=4217 RepID=A0ACB8YIT3_ARCLA|nr:hypothetical protein L6452_34896 [Arctium lappa]
MSTTVMMKSTLQSIRIDSNKFCGFGQEHARGYQEHAKAVWDLLRVQIDLSISISIDLNISIQIDWVF